MRWDYDEETRDLFSKGPHRDILIVPHATYVTPVPGGPPEIKSKVPQYMWIPMPVPIWDAKEKKMKIVTIQHPFPKKDPSTGEVLRKDVEWVITNDDIIKEKFKLSHSLNSEENLSFSSCNAAMVQFTIRNKKQYIEELDDQDEPTGNYYWEQEVPNLQNYEFVEKDPDGNERKIVGELSGNACIKVYTYINGDSSTLMYLGMFQVEEDKMIDNGYNRQITAYDFMAYFRDCDIFYWYKHLWTGINKLDNDFEDYTSNDDSKEKKKPDNYDDPDNWVRKPAKDLYPDRDGRWTIGEALKDLFNNFAAYDMITYDEEEVEVEDPDTHEKKKVKTTVAKLGNTVTNPNNYGRNYEEGTGYTGLGMPVILDPDLFENPETHEKKKYNIPTEPGSEVYECYGYMDALDIEFYQDPNIMKSESLSMGKFLEDIGLLAGRYPYIRTDHLQDDDWFDPATVPHDDEHKYDNRYNNYEKCILTFKPLPTAQDDSKLPIDSILDNTEISKGFSHESYTVDDIEIVKINFQDKSKIEYSRLTASQRKEKKSGNVQTFTFSDNIFVSYLVEKSDNEEIKKKLEKYKELRNKIFGKTNKKGNMSSKALFAQGYYNMKYRSYVPYELTTFADPVRDVGDRIKIIYTDAVTGEHLSFYTYILEREMNGIQKCMDTYKAQGASLNPVFSNYKTGSTYQSGSSYAASSFGYNAVYSGTGTGGSSGSGALGITPSDLVQYWRNFGIRLLDEPSNCEAKFVKGASMEAGGEEIKYNLLTIDDPSYPGEDYVKNIYVTKGYFDNDPTINPITVFYFDNNNERVTYSQSIEVHDLDCIQECKEDDSIGDWSDCATWLYYQGKWHIVEDCDPGEEHNYDNYWFANIIANEGQRSSPNDDYITEGLNSFSGLDNTEIPNGYEFCSTYDVITINGAPTQVNFMDGVMNICAWEPIVYMPPGIWKYSNFCGTAGNDNMTLGANYHFNYLGVTKTALTDGSTQTTILMRYGYGDTSAEKTVNEYDQVETQSGNKDFIFFDGTWHDISDNKNIIMTLNKNNTQPSSLDNYPELKEVVVYTTKSGQQSIDFNRLIGIDLNQITINGTKRDIQVFDTIKLTGSGSSYDADLYYIYTPLNVWTKLGASYSYTSNQWLTTSIGCNQFTVPVKQATNDTKKYVSLKWSDPQDITDWKPTPATWEGTVIVRKENSAPLHRWDGEKVVRTTTRDKYKTKAYKDKDIKVNKVYYYGFFPYYTKISDPDHPIRFYTFTKSIRVETGVITYAPVIVSIIGDNNTLIVQYIINAPTNVNYTSIKLYGKIGETPKCDNTDDICEDLNKDETECSISNLNYNTEYYFVIQCIDTDEAETNSNVMSYEIGDEPDRMLINLGPSNRTAWIASTNTTSTNFITRYSPDSLFPEGKNIVYSTGLSELIYEMEVEYEVQLYAYEWIDQYYFEMLAYNQIYVDGAWTGTYSRFKYYLIDPNVDYFLNIVQPEITLHSKVVESAIDSTYGTKINLVKDNQLHKINIKLIYVNIDNGCSAGTIIRLNRIKYYLDDTMIGTISLPSSSGQYIITGGIVTNRTGYEMAGINNYLRFYSNLSDIYTRTDLSSLLDIKMNYFYNTIEYLDKDNVFTVLKDDPFILNYLKRPNAYGLGSISSERAFTSLIEKPGIDFANYLQEIIDGSTAYDTEYTVFSDDVLTITILNQPSSNDMKIRVFSNKPVIPERSDSLDQYTTVSIGEYNYYKETLHDTMYIYAVVYTFPNARMSQIEFIFDVPASSSPTGRSSSARLPVTGMVRSLDNPFCSPDPRYTTEYNKGNKSISRPLCVSLYEYYHPHDSYDSGYTLPPNQYDIIKSFKLKLNNTYEDRFVDKTTVLLDYLNGIKHEIFDSFYVKNDGWSLNVTSVGKPYLWATSVYKDYWTGTIAPAGVIIKIKPNSIMYLYAILEMVKSPNYNYTQFVGLGWYHLTKSTTEEDTYYIRSGDYQIRDGFIYPTDQFCGNPMPTSDKRVVMEYMQRNYSSTDPIYLIPNISMDTQPLMGKMTANALQFYVIKMALVGDVEFVHGTVKRS